MIDHTGFVVSDLAKARRFYDAVAKALGLGTIDNGKEAFLLGRGAEESIPYLWIGTTRPSYWAEGSRPGLNQTHVAFVAQSKAMVKSSIAPPWRRGDVTTASRVFAKAGTFTTARSCWIPTATTSKRAYAVPRRAEQSHGLSR